MGVGARGHGACMTDVGDSEEIKDAPRSRESEIETAPAPAPDTRVRDGSSIDVEGRDAPLGSAVAGPRELLGSIADGVHIRESYAVSLEMFEGPLDLLLHLVRRHELDILDIPISFITEKYVEYLGFAQALDIEVAGEYLVMAATLAYLKSRELLPPEPTVEEDEEQDEEGEDPREALIRRLLEYERFRAAGEDLDARPIEGRDVFMRGAEVEVDPFERGLAPVTLFKLAEAYNRILDRARITAEHEVEIEPVDVRERMSQLSLMFGDSPNLDFEGIFLARAWSSENELRQMLVVTLMSILEMVKMGLISVHQPDGSSSLVIEREVAGDQMNAAVRAFAEHGDDTPVGEVRQTPAALNSIFDQDDNRSAAAGVGEERSERASGDLQAAGHSEDGGETGEDPERSSSVSRDSPEISAGPSEEKIADVVFGPQRIPPPDDSEQEQ